MNETLLFFGVMGSLFVIVILVGVIQIFKTNSLRKSFFQATGIGLLLYALASLWWFFIFASDGFSQFFGVIYYGIAFLTNCIANLGIVYFINKIRQAEER